MCDKEMPDSIYQYKMSTVTMQMNKIIDYITTGVDLHPLISGSKPPGR